MIKKINTNMKKLTTLYLLLFVLVPLNIFSQNINISNGNVFDGEPYIAVNPYNSQHIIVAWMGYKFTQKIAIKTTVSFDGGNSWSEIVSLKHANPLFTSADPSIAFGPNEEIYISFVDFTGIDTEPLQGGIYLAKSIDGGLNWNQPALVLDSNADPEKRCIDRPWISVDRSGKNTNGNIYITSMNAKGANAPYHPYISISTDHGEHFSWKYIDDTEWLSGNAIPQPMPTNTITSDGILYCIYPSYAPFQSPLPRFIVAKSEDGGGSFTYNTVISTASSVNSPHAKKGYLLSSDPSNPHHLIFLGLTNSSGNIDVGISETFDGGITWTHITKINDDNTNALQDMVWGAFNEKGDYVATWRDRRKASNDSYSNPYEFWAAVKYKDSTSFSENFRISDTLIQFDDLLLSSGNDFMSTAYVSDTLYSVWGDTRNGKLNIWFQKMTLPDKTITKNKIISEKKVNDIKVFPNPANDNIIVEGLGFNEISIFNLDGKKIKTIRFDNFIQKYSIANLQKSSYFLKFKTPKGYVLKKVIVR